MNKGRLLRHDSADDFFAAGGSVWMRLTAAAAISVCQNAADHGLLVAKVEGGVWLDPGFESRLDCIWDGIDPPAGIDNAQKNNMRASEFIQRAQSDHDVFLLTTPSVHGWSHTVRSGQASNDHR